MPSPAVDQGGIDDARLRLASARSPCPTDREQGRSGASARVVRALQRELTRRSSARGPGTHVSERLHAANPLGILERGYAVVTGPGGAVLREATAVEAGDAIRVRLARGALAAEVTEIETNDKLRSRGASATRHKEGR